MDLRHFFLLLLAGGSVYVCIELLWRGRSHGSMFLCGGLCTVLIGMLNEWAPGLPLTAHILLPARAPRGLPHTFHGQICPQYFCGWLGIALLAVFLDDGVRYLAFGEAIGPYCLF